MNIIYVLRMYLGVSQTKLAKLAGITQPDLSEMETKPPYGYLGKYQRLGAVLGVPLEALLKNDFTCITDTFFELHNRPEYTPVPASPDHRLGREGEDFILEREKLRLDAQWPALSKLVLPFYKMKTSSPGYDILSFDEFGKPVCLEVKTSAFDGKSFRITNHELNMARTLTEQGEDYRIVSVQNWGTELQTVSDIPFSELEQTHKITPCYYFCKPIPKRERKIQSGLTYFRRARGLTQKELAERLEIVPCDLSMYETGARQPSVTIYLKASELLDATVDELLARYDVSVEAEGA